MAYKNVRPSWVKSEGDTPSVPCSKSNADPPTGRFGLCQNPHDASALGEILINASANAAVVIQNCVRLMMSIFPLFVVVIRWHRPARGSGHQQLIRQVWRRTDVLGGGPRARSLRSGSVLSDGQSTWVDSVHANIAESTDGDVSTATAGATLGAGIAGRQHGHSKGVST